MEDTESIFTFYECDIPIRDDDFSVEKYTFPAEACTTYSDSVTTRQLRKRLAELVDMRDYNESREEYCRIHVEINRRHGKPGTRAPRFRRQHKRSFPKYGDAYPLLDKLSSNDTQVIDLHWLHCNGRRTAEDRLARKVFKGDSFNFDAAAEFTQYKGTPPLKAELVGLDTDEQWQLALLSWKDAPDDWKKLRSKSTKIMRQLRMLSRRFHQIRGQESEWAWVVIAAEIEQHIISPGLAPNYAQVANWFTLITGYPMIRQTARRKFLAAQKYLDRL